MKKNSALVSAIERTSEQEFLNLSFEELSQVDVRLPLSAQNSLRIDAQQGADVQSKPVDFVNLSFEQLTRLPVRVATLTAKEKEKEQTQSEEVQSSAINLNNLPLVFSEQSLVITAPARGEVQSIEKDLISDTPIAVSSDTASQPSVIVPPNVAPIVVTPIIVLPQFLAIGGVNAVSILLRNGDGSFSTLPSLPIGSPTQGVAVRDLNKDGILDLVVTSVTSNTVSIFLGTGIGTFETQSNFAVSSASQAPAVISDFNGDGNFDLAVSNTGGGVSILLGTGTGSFGPATNFTAGTTPFGIVSGDFNSDNILDLAVANLGSNNVSILLGVGDGSFLAPVNFLLSSTPEMLAVGDFNGDNILDIAVPYASIDTVGIFLGTGSGSFGAEAQFPTSLFPSGIVVGDFNRDGLLDLAIGSSVTDNICILLGTGNGSFGAPTIFGAGGSFTDNLCTGDFNGDGILDLAVVNSGSANMGILFGNGNGTFQSPVLYPLSISSPGAIAVGILLPAGVSGEPINLALSRFNAGEPMTLMVKNIPLDWTLSQGGYQLGGSCILQTNDLSDLTVKAPLGFVGARALEIEINWINSAGENQYTRILENVEVFAPNYPIFALPNDNLTGSVYADTFVIKNSCFATQDVIFNFEVEQDRIDLLGFELNEFSHLTITQDVFGNTCIDIDSGKHKIVLQDVLCDLSAKNFRFDATPFTLNTDSIYVGKEAIMPFGGVLENNGIIYVEGRLIIEGDISGSGKIVVSSGGTIEINGHLNQTILFETESDSQVFEHLDLILPQMTTVSLDTLDILIEF